MVNIQTSTTFDYSSVNQFERTTERTTKKGRKIVETSQAKTDSFININATGSPTIFILHLKQLTEWLNS